MEKEQMGIVFLRTKSFHSNNIFGRFDVQLIICSTIYGRQKSVVITICFAQMFQQLGKTWGRYSGITPVIVTIDPEIIKEVMVKQVMVVYFDQLLSVACTLNMVKTLLGCFKPFCWL